MSARVETLPVIGAQLLQPQQSQGLVCLRSATQTATGTAVDEAAAER